MPTSDLVVAEVDRALAAWQPGVTLDASASLRAAVRRIVVRALFGEHLGAEADRFGALLEPGLRYVQRMPQVRFEHDLRVNAYARVQRANRAADELVRTEIARRRSVGIDADAHPDTLTALLAGVDGETLTDAELLDQVRSLMAAGFDTTAGAASWLVHELGRNPEAFDAVRAEVDAALGDRSPTVDDLRALPLTLGAVQEVLRLWPPGPAAPRMSVAPSVLHGMTIPAGRLVLYSPYVTGRLPELWPDPERFDPGRWAPGAPDPAPYSFVPFGGGPRRCIGFALATLELQVMAVRLAQQVDWRLRRLDAKPTGIATLTPKGGVPIEVTRAGARSGRDVVEVLEQVVGRQLDRLVAPLRGSVHARDEPAAVHPTQVAVDEGVARLGLVGRALGEPEVPRRVVVPAVALHEGVLGVSVGL